MSSFWVLTRTQTWTLESQIQDLEAVIHHNLGLKHLFPLANRRLVTLLLLQLATEALTPSSGLMVWVTNKALDYPRSSSSRNKWLSVAACGRLQISPCQVYRSVYVKCLFTKAKQKSQSRQTKSVGNTLSQTSLGSAYNRRKKASESCAQETTPEFPNLQTILYLRAERMKACRTLCKCLLELQASIDQCPKGRGGCSCTCVDRVGFPANTPSLSPWRLPRSLVLSDSDGVAYGNVCLRFRWVLLLLLTKIILWLIITLVTFQGILPSPSSWFSWGTRVRIPQLCSTGGSIWQFTQIQM